MSRAIKAAIVGAGYISDYHLSTIARTDKVELAAICDLNRVAAEKLAAKSPNTQVYSDMALMLEEVKPQVVHILTQPDSHFALASMAIKAGAHVVVEKPVTANAQEARDLMALATEHKVMVTVNHNFVYSRPFIKLQQAMRNGDIGPLKSVRIVWKNFLAPTVHGPWGLWMLREAENILFETGSHSISELLAVLGQTPEITAVKPRQAKLLPSGKVFYRRWQINAQLGSTFVQLDTAFDQGYEQHFVEVEGLFGVARADIENDIFTLDQNTGRAYDVERLHINMREGCSRIKDALRTYGAYAGSKFIKHWTGGPYENSMINGINDCYAHILNGSGSNETSLNFALQVAELAETIAKHMPSIDRSELGEAAPSPIVVNEPTLDADILIVGASGFIGKRLLTALTDAGKKVRAMVRNPSSLTGIAPSPNCEVMVGDFRHHAFSEQALTGIKHVFHLAVAHGNSLSGYLEQDSEPTLRFANLCQQKGIERFIYTCTIDSLALAHPGKIKESDGVDSQLNRRNNYAHSKAITERRLRDMHTSIGFPVVIVRPAIVLGAGGPPAHVGVANWFGIGRCAYWGKGNNTLPIVLVDDIVDGLCKAVEQDGIEGRTYNLSAEPCISARDYVAEVEKVLGSKIKAYPSPAYKGFLGDLFKWCIKVLAKHPDKTRVPSLHDWRCREQHASFDTTAAQTDLGWQPCNDRETLLEKGVREPTRLFLES